MPLKTAFKTELESEYGSPAPIFDPNYWKQRWTEAAEPRHAVYCCSEPEWKAHEERHRNLLQQIVKPEDNLLDAGCGYGRMLELLPASWAGEYWGLDLSPEMISHAQRTYSSPRIHFLTCDLRKIPAKVRPAGKSQFDLGICCSLKYTVLNHCGTQAWSKILVGLSRICESLLFLEFDLDEERASA